MPSTREEHVLYTRNELNTYSYYIDVIEYLKQKNIKSYIDIGANVGEFCNVLFEKLPTLEKAYAVEPENSNFEFLKENIKNKENVVCINTAIGYNFQSPKIVPFHDNVGGFKVLEDAGDYPNTTMSTLEELNLPIVDLVKIDIEGGEYNIIENSKYLQNVKFIELEFHDYEKVSTRDYVAKYFPHHIIKVIEPLEGRCLLEKLGKIYDGFLFYNELDLLEIRLNTLNDVVDYFILVESSVTHSGKPKPFIFEENKERFDKFLSKIIHIKVTDTPDDFLNTPYIIPDTFNNKCVYDTWEYISKTKSFDRATQPHFGRDFYQKECIKRGMKHASDNDILIFSDLDEIPNPEIISRLNEFYKDTELYTFNQTMYCYYFNLLRKSHINNTNYNREITHIWKGSRMGGWGLIKNNSLNEIRAQDNNDIMDGGWHFSYMGGTERVKQKIEASSAIEWNNIDVISNLENRLNEEQDVICRGDYLYKVDIDDTYPKYFLDNLTKFKYLIK